MKTTYKTFKELSDKDFPEVRRDDIVFKTVEHFKQNSYGTLYTNFIDSLKILNSKNFSVFDIHDAKSMDENNCFITKDTKTEQILISRENGVCSRSFLNSGFQLPAYEKYNKSEDGTFENYECHFKIAGLFHNLTDAAYVEKRRSERDFSSFEKFVVFGMEIYEEEDFKKYSATFTTEAQLLNAEQFAKDNSKLLNRFAKNIEILANPLSDKYQVATAKSIVEKCSTTYYIPLNEEYKECLLKHEVKGHFAFLPRKEGKELEFASLNNSNEETWPRFLYNKDIKFTGTLYDGNRVNKIKDGFLHSDDGPASYNRTNDRENIWSKNGIITAQDFVAQIEKQATKEITDELDKEVLAKYSAGSYGSEYMKSKFITIDSLNHLSEKSKFKKELEQKYSPLDKNEKDLNMPLYTPPKQPVFSGSIDHKSAIAQKWAYDIQTSVPEDALAFVPEVSSPKKEKTTPMKKTAKDHYKEAAKQAAYETAAEEIVSSIKAAGMLALQASHPNLDPKTLELLNNTYVEAFISLAIGEGMRHLPPHISENPHAIELGKRFTVQGMKQGVQPLLKIGKEMIAPMIEDVISRIPKDEVLPPKRTRVAPKKKIEVLEDSEIEVEFKESESEKHSSRL